MKMLLPFLISCCTISIPILADEEKYDLILKGIAVPPDGLSFEPEQFKIWLATHSDTFESNVTLDDNHHFTARFPTAPAGKYTLYSGIFALEENAQLGKAFQHGFMVENSDQTIEMDLGKIEMVKKNFLPNGSTAPAFELDALNGGKVNLKDYRGKVVLLDFWAAWCGHCKTQKPHIKALYEKYHKKYNFEIIGISFDKDMNLLKSYIKENDIPWKQVVIGGFDHPLVKDFSIISIPFTILVSPDGKILKKDLKGEHGIEQNLEAILKEYKKK